MDSVICTNVNNLLNLHCNLKKEFNTFKSEVENNTFKSKVENNNELTIIDLENNYVKLGNLTANNITVDNITASNANISEEINTVDIYCKNLYASNNVETENLTAETIATEDLTGNSATINTINGTNGNLTNVYSTYTESQTVAVTSDKRMKKNITKVKDERLKELTPVRFKYINNDKKYVYGLIAQDVELIYPDMIHTLQNGNKAIDYNQFISLLILKTNAIEERLISIENTQASIKKFIGLLILAFFIILFLIFLPKKYINLRYLLRVFMKIKYT